MTPNAPELARSPISSIVPALIILALVGSTAFLITQTDQSGSQIVVFAAVAAIVYILTLFDIRIGLVVTIGAIAMSPEFSAGGIRDLRLEDFLIPVLLFSWITSKEPSKPSHLRGPIGLYLGVTLISTLVGISLGSVDALRSLLITAKFIEYFVLLYLVANVVREQNEVRFFTYALVIFGVLTAGQALLLRPESVPGAIETRVGGPVGETANIFSGFLIMIVALCIGLFTQAKSMRERVLLVLTCLFLFYISLITYSRTGYVALVVGLLIFGIIKRRQILAVAMIGVVVFALIAPNSVWHRASTILGVVGDNAPSSYTARVDAWDSSARTDFVRSPLIGNGPGFRPFGWLDNEYFRILVDTGLIGVFAFLWLMFRLIRISNNTYNISDEGTFPRGLGAGYLLAVLCMMVHAWGATSFTAIRTMETFMVLTGLLIAQWNILAREKPEAVAALNSQSVADDVPVLLPGTPR